MIGVEFPKTVCGSWPFHFSIARRWASTRRSSIRLVVMASRCRARDLASACAVAIFCSASMRIRSRSRLALSASCSAICLASIALANSVEKSKSVI